MTVASWKTTHPPVVAVRVIQLYSLKAIAIHYIDKRYYDHAIVLLTFPFISIRTLTVTHATIAPTKCNQVKRPIKTGRYRAKKSAIICNRICLHFFAPFLLNAIFLHHFSIKEEESFIETCLLGEYNVHFIHACI